MIQPAGVLGSRGTYKNAVYVDGVPEDKLDALKWKWKGLEPPPGLNRRLHYEARAVKYLL